MLNYMVIVLFAIMLVFASTLIVRRALFLHRCFSHPRMVGELYIPSALLLLYGYFGFFHLLVGRESSSMGYGVPFISVDVLLGFIYMLLVAFAYFLGFVYFAKGKNLKRNSLVMPNRSTQQGVFIFFIAILMLDLAVRTDLILSGQYFSWMRGSLRINDGVTISPLAMLQDGFSPLLAVLTMYYARENKRWYIYLVVLLALVILEAKRMKILFTVVAIVIALLFIHGRSLNVKRILKLSIVWGLVLGISFSTVLEVRRQYRDNKTQAIENPVSFIFTATVKGVSRTLNIESESAYTMELKGTPVSERGTAWSTTFASQVYRLRNDYNYLPMSWFFKEMALIVPSALWPGEKPTISAGGNAGRAFGFGATNASRHFDPATTVFSSLFLYFGIIGSALFAYFIGAVIGLIYRHLISNYKTTGGVIFFGLVYYFQITSNSYSGILVGFRNALILLAVLYFINKFMFRKKINSRLLSVQIRGDEYDSSS